VALRIHASTSGHPLRVVVVLGLMLLCVVHARPSTELLLLLVWLVWLVLWWVLW